MFTFSECLQRQKELRKALTLQKDDEEDIVMCKTLHQWFHKIELKRF
jgi:hypothetical protein